MLLSAMLRNRLAVVVAAAMLLALQFWAMTVVPVYLLRALSLVSNVVGRGSDIVPHMPDRELRSLVFSLNPGMRITALHLNGNETAYTHESGLLTVTPVQRLAVGTTVVLSMRASGVPDPEFGYLDGAVDWRRQPSGNLIRTLGTQASLFHRNYVALMPAVHWLPAAGANVDREDPSRRPPDFFEVDLVAEVPPDWLVAGPGRQPHDDGEPGRVRLRPVDPLSEVAVLAGVFERRAVEVHGIELELLAHPRHMPNLDRFAEAGDVIRGRLLELFTKLEDAGLPYREATLSLVEVPAPLRTYRGGWRLDAVRAPGVLLLREETLPLGRHGYYDNQVETDGWHDYLVRRGYTKARCRDSWHRRSTWSASPMAKSGSRATN